MSTHTSVQQHGFRRRWPLARVLSLLLILLTAVVILGFFWFGGLFAPEESTPPKELLEELEAYDKAVTITRSIIIKGRDEKGRPYLITASRSRRDEVRKDITQLFDVAGKLQQSDGTPIFFRANRADVNRETDDVTLVGKVLIHKQGSWRLRAPEVLVHAKTRDMTSDHPVVVRRSGTIIHAQGIEVKNEGDLVRFRGPVHARFGTQQEQEGARSSGATTGAQGNETGEARQ